MKTRRRTVIVVLGAILLVGVIAGLLLRKRERSYQVTFLPSPCRGRVIPHAINDRGQIAGIAKETRGPYKPFLWPPDTGTGEAVALQAQRTAGHLHVNDVGQIAGTLVDPNGNKCALLWDSDGTEVPLGTLGGQASCATAINRQGQIVGWSETSDGSRHAFVWDAAGGMQDLGTLGGRQSRACSINDSGQVTGYTQMGDTQWRAVLWDPNGGISNLGYGSSDPLAMCLINNNGLIVGDFSSIPGKRYISTWQREAGIRPLRPIVNEFVLVCSVNDANECLLRVFRPGYSVFGHRFGRGSCSHLWSPGKGFRLIRPCFGRKGTASFVAHDMDNRGRLVGSLEMETAAQNIRWGVLLEPIR